ncbi:hypothetical protein ACS0TY_029276 [Phlomoides rotata]
MAATPPLILWFLLLSSSMLPSMIAVSEFSLDVSGPTVLQLSPSFIVEKYPGSKPGTKVKCERILIHGLPRIKHLKKFANSLKVKVSCVIQSVRPPIVEVCFHRNSSLGIGMCPQDQWERLTTGLWTKAMSPFDHKILDIRVAAFHSEILQVSIDEEFFLYRIFFLVLGILLMSLASWLSKSLVFYYGGAMATGSILLILMVLFQGMRLLPTGRKSSLAIFLYSCFVGLGTFLLRYVPYLLRSLLVEIGLSEDMYDPLLILLLVALLIFGSFLGFWFVRKLVLTDGSIDSGVSHFVSWSIRIVASVLILQSSIDPLLAAEALVGGAFVSSLLRRCGHPKVVRRVYKKLYKLNKVNLREAVDPYASPVVNSSLSKASTKARYASSPRGPARESDTFYSTFHDTPDLSKTSTKARYSSPPRGPARESDTFYSTFHDTPARRKFTKQEWESFTEESTRRALEELVSSPDFSKWAVSHADRITLAPKTAVADKQRRRWFQWF